MRCPGDWFHPLSLAYINLKELAAVHCPQKSKTKKRYISTSLFKHVSDIVSQQRGDSSASMVLDAFAPLTSSEEGSVSGILRASHIKGVQNIIADALFQINSVGMEWSLSWDSLGWI